MILKGETKMKFLSFVLSVVLVSISAVAFAQSGAQESFAKLKTLAGSWEGHVTTVPPEAGIQGQLMQVSLRTTSSGNALLHEMTGAGRPDDPITMLYLDENRLLLTHYCDAGNRPRMTGKTSPDGKTIEFDFLDIAGNTQYGHMDHAVFTFVDANHHIEDWTFIVKGDKPVVAHFDLQRTQ